MPVGHLLVLLRLWAGPDLWSHAHPDGDKYPVEHTHAYGHEHTHANIHQHTVAHTHIYLDADQYTNQFAYSHADLDADQHTDTRSFGWQSDRLYQERRSYCSCFVSCRSG